MLSMLPNSPTILLFPPSHELPEWRDRCFRCFRKGHGRKMCTFPTRCATCLGQGHEYRQCPSGKKNFASRKVGDESFHSRAYPVHQNSDPRLAERKVVSVETKLKDPTYPMRKMVKKEPGFQELFSNNAPSRGLMPDSDRPQSVKCFIARDEAFFNTVEELHNAVVVTVPHDEQITGAEVVNSIAQAAGVRVDKFSVVNLAGPKFMVMGKRGVDVPHCAASLPEEWWNKGFKAERWSPLTEAGIQALSFKVWIDFVVLPPHLRRESYVAQAVREFGVYLGSVPNPDINDWSRWGAVAAVPNLGVVPHEVVFTVGALEYKVRVVSQRWINRQVYTSADFPKLPEKMVPPSARSPVLDFNGDSLTIRLHDIKKIFRHVPTTDLPPDKILVKQNEEGNNTKGKAAADREMAVELLRRDLSVQPRQGSSSGGPARRGTAGGAHASDKRGTAIKATVDTQSGLGEAPQQIHKRGRGALEGSKADEQEGRSTGAQVHKVGKRQVRMEDRTG